MNSYSVNICYRNNGKSKYTKVIDDSINNIMTQITNIIFFEIGISNIKDYSISDDELSLTLYIKDNSMYIFSIYLNQKSVIPTWNSVIPKELGIRNIV